MKLFDFFESRDMCNVCGQTPCNCTHITESVANPGRRLIELFNLIYRNGGDDAVDYLLYNSPIFADYYDQYEGDLESIAAEVGPKELAVMVDELEEVAENEGLAENVDIGKEWMSDTELDQYVPDALEQEWRELVGYNEDGNAHPLWINMTGDYEPRSSDPQHRAWMVKVANKWFAKKKIPNVTFFDVRDHDTEDELEWLVQIGQQGVAEGSNDTVYPNAEVIKSKNGKPVGEIYQDGNEWGCFHYRADRGYDMIDSREDAIQALKDLHSETARHRPDYTIKGVAEMDKSQPSHGRDGKISHSTYGSRDKGGSTGLERTARATTADKMMRDAHDAMMKSMSAADKVKKGWRNTKMKEDTIDENLRDWFKEKWVRFGPDGKIRGDCARGDDSEGKPKCLPQAKAHALGKKGRATAASRKRREDPNPERSGPAINVKTKESQIDELKCWPGHHRVPGTKAGTPGSCAKNESIEEEQQKCPECGGPMFSELMINEKKDACYYKVKSRYKVWPSAYASGALVKCRKSHGKWGSKSEGVAEDNVQEKWSAKYKSSINCNNPKGFSQKAHCAGRKKHSEGIEEAANPAQQAAIAIAMKKAGKKPKTEQRVTPVMPVTGGQSVKTYPPQPVYTPPIGKPNTQSKPPSSGGGRSPAAIIDIQNIPVSEAISGLDLADALFKVLDQTQGDIVRQYGHDIVGDAIMDVVDKYGEIASMSDLDIAVQDVLERLQAKTNVQESRHYFVTAGTSAGELRNKFGLRKDNKGWFLSESNSNFRKLYLEATRTFTEYDLSKHTVSAATIGDDNFVSPVGSVPRGQQKQKVKKNG